MRDGLPHSGGCRTEQVVAGSRWLPGVGERQSKVSPLPSHTATVIGVAMMGARVFTDAAQTLLRVLAEVDAGRVVEGGPRGAALRRRLEGAVAALQAMSRRP